MTQEGYGQAYQRGFELTRQFLRSRGIPGDLALEVTQAAWVKGWEKRQQLRNEEVVVAWVNSIALNVYRQARRREGVSTVFRDHRTSSGHNFAAIDMSLILRICRPGDRVLLEQQMCGHTPREIARMRGVPESAIRVKLLRARRAARLRIHQVGANS